MLHLRPQLNMFSFWPNKQRKNFLKIVRYKKSLLKLTVYFLLIIILQTISRTLSRFHIALDYILDENFKV